MSLIDVTAAGYSMVQYEEDRLYPYRYYSVSPISGSVLDSGTITISFTYNHYSGWTSPKILYYNFVQVWFFDSNGTYLSYEYVDGYMSTSIDGTSGSVTIDLSKCTNSYKSTAAIIAVLIETETSGKNANGNGIAGTAPVVNTSYEAPAFTLIHYTACGAPTSPAVSQTLSRGAVTLSWGAGSAGTNNSVTGYDVERRESSDGSSWGSWATVSGSPVTGTSLDVTPPGTVGNYYQYRVRTRGSAGSDYYSGWVTSTNTLRRKWDAFGAWTDATLTAGVSSIRAVHLTQLQERVAAIRAFYGLSAYSFTAVTARKTKIAKWAALIGELRSAIDGITTNHAAWNTLEAGKPRIAHITQLRDIIDNM